MDDKQTINCTVDSCKYNNKQNKMCNLKQIVVQPTTECDTQNCDESMCGSYEYHNN